MLYIFKHRRLARLLKELIRDSRVSAIGDCSNFPFVNTLFSKSSRGNEWYEMLPARRFAFASFRELVSRSRIEE